MINSKKDLTTDNIEDISLPQITQEIKSGTYFFRAQRLKNIRDLQNWNQRSFGPKPAYKITKTGRLNKVHEEMLYYSAKSSDSLNEIQYDFKSPAVIAVYRAKQPFSTLMIGQNYNAKKITNLGDTQKQKLLNSLLKIKSLFEDKTDKNNELTLKIRDQFYPLRGNQAWIYPGMKGEKPYSFNLAMFPGIAKDYLEFVGAVVISDANDQGKKHIEFCFDQNYRLDYVKNYSKLKRIFGLE